MDGLDREGFRDFAMMRRDQSEREALRCFLTQLKPPAHLKNAAWDAAEAAGGMSLPIWNEFFGDMPFNLGILPKGRMKDITSLNHLFSKSKTNVLLKKYRELQEQLLERQGRPTVMLVKVPFVQDWCAFHNCVSNSVRSVRVTIRISDNQEVYLEPVTDFCEEIQQYLTWGE